MENMNVPLPRLPREEVDFKTEWKKTSWTGARKQKRISIDKEGAIIVQYIAQGALDRFKSFVMKSIGLWEKSEGKGVKRQIKTHDVDKLKIKGELKRVYPEQEEGVTHVISIIKLPKTSTGQINQMVRNRIIEKQNQKIIEPLEDLEKLVNENFRLLKKDSKKYKDNKELKDEFEEIKEIRNNLKILKKKVSISPSEEADNIVPLSSDNVEKFNEYLKEYVKLIKKEMITLEKIEPIVDDKQKIEQEKEKAKNIVNNLPPDVKVKEEEAQKPKAKEGKGKEKLPEFVHVEEKEGEAEPVEAQKPKEPEKGKEKEKEKDVEKPTVSKPTVSVRPHGKTKPGSKKTTENVLNKKIKDLKESQKQFASKFVNQNEFDHHNNILNSQIKNLESLLSEITKHKGDLTSKEIKKYGTEIKKALSKAEHSIETIENLKVIGSKKELEELLNTEIGELSKKHESVANKKLFSDRFNSLNQIVEKSIQGLNLYLPNDELTGKEIKEKSGEIRKIVNETEDNIGILNSIKLEETEKEKVKPEEGKVKEPEKVKEKEIEKPPQKAEITESYANKFLENLLIQANKQKEQKIGEGISSALEKLIPLQEKLEEVSQKAKTLGFNDLTKQIQDARPVTENDLVKLLDEIEQEMASRIKEQQVAEKPIEAEKPETKVEQKVEKAPTEVSIEMQPQVRIGSKEEIEDLLNKTIDSLIDTQINTLEDMALRETSVVHFNAIDKEFDSISQELKEQLDSVKNKGDLTNEEFQKYSSNIKKIDANIKEIINKAYEYIEQAIASKKKSVEAKKEPQIKAAGKTTYEIMQEEVLSTHSGTDIIDSLNDSIEVLDDEIDKITEKLENLYGNEIPEEFSKQLDGIYDNIEHLEKWGNENLENKILNEKEFNKVAKFIEKAIDVNQTEIDTLKSMLQVVEKEHEKEKEIRHEPAEAKPIPPAVSLTREEKELSEMLQIGRSEKERNAGALSPRGTREIEYVANIPENLQQFYSLESIENVQNLVKILLKEVFSQPAPEGNLALMSSEAKNAYDSLKAEIKEGNTVAMNVLGKLFRDGIGGIRPEPNVAFKIFERSAELGDPIGMNLLGRCYKEGIGVAVDEKKSFECYKESAEKGYVPARHNMAASLLDGIGVEKDERGAFEIFLELAELGYEDSKIAVAGCYRYGVGTEKDEAKADFWAPEVRIEEITEVSETKRGVLLGNLAEDASNFGLSLKGIEELDETVKEYLINERAEKRNEIVNKLAESRSDREIESLKQSISFEKSIDDKLIELLKTKGSLVDKADELLETIGERIYSSLPETVEDQKTLDDLKVRYEELIENKSISLNEMNVLLRDTQFFFDEIETLDWQEDWKDTLVLAQCFTLILQSNAQIHQNQWTAIYDDYHKNAIGKGTISSAAFNKMMADIEDKVSLDKLSPLSELTTDEMEWKEVLENTKNKANLLKDLNKTENKFSETIKKAEKHIETLKSLNRPDYTENAIKLEELLENNKIPDRKKLIESFISDEQSIRIFEERLSDSIDEIENAVKDSQDVKTVKEDVRKEIKKFKDKIIKEYRDFLRGRGQEFFPGGDYSLIEEEINKSLDSVEKLEKEFTVEKWMGLRTDKKSINDLESEDLEKYKKEAFEKIEQEKANLEAKTHLGAATISAIDILDERLKMKDTLSEGLKKLGREGEKLADQFDAFVKAEKATLAKVGVEEKGFDFDEFLASPLVVVGYRPSEEEGEPVKVTSEKMEKYYKQVLEVEKSISEAYEQVFEASKLIDQYESALKDEKEVVDEFVRNVPINEEWKNKLSATFVKDTDIVPAVSKNPAKTSAEFKEYKEKIDEAVKTKIQTFESTYHVKEILNAHYAFISTLQVAEDATKSLEEEVSLREEFALTREAIINPLNQLAAKISSPSDMKKLLDQLNEGVNKLEEFKERALAKGEPIKGEVTGAKTEKSPLEDLIELEKLGLKEDNEAVLQKKQEVMKLFKEQIDECNERYTEYSDKLDSLPDEYKNEEWYQDAKKVVDKNKDNLNKLATETEVEGLLYITFKKEIAKLSAKELGDYQLKLNSAIVEGQSKLDAEAEMIADAYAEFKSATFEVEQQIRELVESGQVYTAAVLNDKLIEERTNIVKNASNEEDLETAINECKERLEKFADEKKYAVEWSKEDQMKFLKVSSQEFDRLETQLKGESKVEKFEKQQLINKITMAVDTATKELQEQLKKDIKEGGDKLLGKALREKAVELASKRLDELKTEARVSTGWFGGTTTKPLSDLTNKKLEAHLNSVNESVKAQQDHVNSIRKDLNAAELKYNTAKNPVNSQTMRFIGKDQFIHALDFRTDVENVYDEVNAKNQNLKPADNAVDFELEVKQFSEFLTQKAKELSEVLKEAEEWEKQSIRDQLKEIEESDYNSPEGKKLLRVARNEFKDVVESYDPKLKRFENAVESFGKISNESDWYKAMKETVEGERKLISSPVDGMNIRELDEHWNKCDRGALVIKETHLVEVMAAFDGWQKALEDQRAFAQELRDRKPAQNSLASQVDKEVDRLENEISEKAKEIKSNEGMIELKKSIEEASSTLISFHEDIENIRDIDIKGKLKELLKQGKTEKDVEVQSLKELYMIQTDKIVKQKIKALKYYREQANTLPDEMKNWINGNIDEGIKKLKELKWGIQFDVGTFWSKMKNNEDLFVTELFKRRSTFENESMKIFSDAVVHKADVILAFGAHEFYSKELEKAETKLLELLNDNQTYNYNHLRKVMEDGLGSIKKAKITSPKEMEKYIKLLKDNAQKIAKEIEKIDAKPPMTLSQQLEIKGDHIEEVKKKQIAQINKDINDFIKDLRPVLDDDVIAKVEKLREGRVLSDAMGMEEEYVDMKDMRPKELADHASRVKSELKALESKRQAALADKAIDFNVRFNEDEVKKIVELEYYPDTEDPSFSPLTLAEEMITRAKESLPKTLDAKSKGIVTRAFNAISKGSSLFIRQIDSEIELITKTVNEAKNISYKDKLAWNKVMNDLLIRSEEIKLTLNKNRDIAEEKIKELKAEQEKVKEYIGENSEIYKQCTRNIKLLENIQWDVDKVDLKILDQRVESFIETFQKTQQLLRDIEKLRSFEKLTMKGFQNDVKIVNKNIGIHGGFLLNLNSLFDKEPIRKMLQSDQLKTEDVDKFIEGIERKIGESKIQTLSMQIQNVNSSLKKIKNEEIVREIEYLKHNYKDGIKDPRQAKEAADAYNEVWVKILEGR